MIVTFAQGIAPMTVIRADGGADGIRLGLADQPHAVRLDEVLQYARSRVVAGDQEHLRLWLFRLGGFRSFLAKGSPACLLQPVFLA